MSFLSRRIVSRLAGLAFGLATLALPAAASYYISGGTTITLNDTDQHTFLDLVSASQNNYLSKSFYVGQTLTDTFYSGYPGVDTATASASAAMGLLSSYNYAKTTSTYTGGYMVFSQTDITVGDFIAISGPTTLTFNLDLSGAFSHLGSGWGGMAELHLSVGQGLYTASVYDYSDGSTLHSPSGALTLNVTQAMLNSYGQGLSIQYELEAWTRVYGNSSATADFSHTANIYVDSSNPNVTLTSSSGHNYSENAGDVPEPATWWLLAGALPMAGFLRKRS
jgi:hypothetical protein